jgi:predicted dehydrogenase
MIRLGISSAGIFVEKGILPRLEKVKNIKVTAISVKHSQDRATILADRFGIKKKYFEFEEILNDADIDAVYICSPNVFHKEMVVAAANAGKHIICEKPLGMNAEECIEMVQICKDNNVKLAVDFCYPRTGAQQKVKQIVDEGTLGEISNLHMSFSLCNFTKEVGGWRCNPKISGGGALMDLVPHLVHLACYILNDTVKSVMAYVSPEKTDEDVEKDSLSMLEFKRGVKVSIDSSFKRCRNHNFTIIGSKGSVYAEGTMGWQTGGKIILQTLTDDFHNEQISFDEDMGIENNFRLFAKAIEEDTVVPATGEDGLHIQMVIDAIYESGKTGKRINL